MMIFCFLLELLPFYLKNVLQKSSIAKDSLFLCAEIKDDPDSRRYCDKYHRAPLQPLLRREKNEA